MRKLTGGDNDDLSVTELAVTGAAPADGDIVIGDLSRLATYADNASMQNSNKAMKIIHKNKKL